MGVTGPISSWYNSAVTLLEAMDQIPNWYKLSAHPLIPFADADSQQPSASRAMVRHPEWEVAFGNVGLRCPKSHRKPGNPAQISWVRIWDISHYRSSPECRPQGDGPSEMNSVQNVWAQICHFHRLWGVNQQRAEDRRQGPVPATSVGADSQLV